MVALPEPIAHMIGGSADVEINVVRAWIVTEECRHKLTVAVAKQFPMKSGHDCYVALVVGQPAPICKVRGRVLGYLRIEWLVLVLHPLSGYVWVEHRGNTELLVDTPMVVFV